MACRILSYNRRARNHARCPGSKAVSIRKTTIKQSNARTGPRSGGHGLRLGPVNVGIRPTEFFRIDNYAQSGLSIIPCMNSPELISALRSLLPSREFLHAFRNLFRQGALRQTVGKSDNRLQQSRLQADTAPASTKPTQKTDRPVIGKVLVHLRQRSGCHGLAE